MGLSLRALHSTALDRAVGRELAAVCDWLALPVTEVATNQPQLLPSTGAELVARIGPGSLAHVGFVRRPPADLPDRMRRRREAILRRIDGHGIDGHGISGHGISGPSLRQHVVVLGHGTVLGDAAGDDAPLPFDVAYVRLESPERLLANPALAPFAVLARAADGDERAAVLAQALKTIRTHCDDDEQRRLGHRAVVLARLHLQRPAITELMRRSGVPTPDVGVQMVEAAASRAS